MRIRWRNFELPSKVFPERESKSETYAKFVVEPFEKGFGHTIGNGLRRVLLSSIEGYAITEVKIDGVLHEFTAIPGVYEDVTDIVLNVKGILVRLTGADTAKLLIDVKRKGAVTASDIQADQHTEILNPRHHIATLTDEVSFRMELEAAKGRGYVTAEENEKEEKEIGVIPVDSNFSPVTRVRYKVEATRVGKITNYDRLILEVWTNGTVSPEVALVEASRIYRKHLNPLVNYTSLSLDIPVEEETPEPLSECPAEIHVRDLLCRPIEELDLSVRAKNCLDSENIATVGDLVRRTEAELLKVRNFGRTSLKEIKKKLMDLNLSLGMDVAVSNNGS
ncbi:MAG: DNA-directed RNA polymerase subunit alpha [Planctomycetota bacterium]